MSRRITIALTSAALTLVLATAGASGGPSSPGQQPPVNQTPPSVSGTAEVPNTLTAATGKWTGKALKYAYQWLRCDSNGANCSAIGGATTSMRLLATADVGYTLRVIVTASNKNGSAGATSPQTAVVSSAPSPPAPPPAPPPSNVAPSDDTPPSVSGTTQQGQTLSASTGSWSGTTPMTYTYQWQRCDSGGAACGPISGANAVSYVLALTDVGLTIRVSVTASNSGGSATASSAATAVVSSSGVTGVTLYAKNWEDGLVDSAGWTHQASDNLGTSAINGIVYGTIGSDATTADRGTRSGKFSLPASSYKEGAMMLHSRTVQNGSDEWFAMAFDFPTGWPSAVTDSSGATHWLNISCPNYYSVNGCMVSVAAGPNYLYTLINSGACPASGVAPGCPYYSGTPEGGGFACRGMPTGTCGPHYIVPPGQLTLNVWHEIIMHVYYTLDNRGVVEFWHRVKGQSSWTKTVSVSGGFPTLQTGPTAFGTTVTASNISGWRATDQFGLYRGPEADPATMWADNWCRGSSFDAVAACFS